jgi:hypothetical protein
MNTHHGDTEARSSSGLLSRNIAPIWILLTMFVAVPIALMASCVGYSAFQARRPKDMPNAIWIDAPAVPFGYYRGWWEGCWVDSGQQTNHCRLYSREVVFEGRFMPCEGKSPIPMTELKLRPPARSESMWIFPGFVAFLEDGRILVPLENVPECPKVLERLEYKKIQGYEGNN